MHLLLLSASCHKAAYPQPAQSELVTPENDMVDVTIFVPHIHGASFRPCRQGDSDHVTYLQVSQVNLLIQVAQIFTPVESSSTSEKRNLGQTK